MIYNSMNDIKNLSDKDLTDFLKRYWKTNSFNFYGEFVPEQRVASFYCGYIKHVKVPGTSTFMSYPFIRKAVGFKIPARCRIKAKGFYKFSCFLAPIAERMNANNYCQIKLDFDSLMSISDATYRGAVSINIKTSYCMTEEEKELFDELHDRKQKDLETFMDEDYGGFMDSVVNKYPESAHFIYELLQNADDAQASSAEFILLKKGLVFAHNGTRHFNITDRKNKNIKLGDINAIVNIGHNAKDGVSTIGKFGVGFKSVFQYTVAPEIYDDKFKFRIDNFIVPTLINHDFKGRKEGQTLFYIPFKNKVQDYNRIKIRLENLRSPILFLNNLTQVKWKEEGEISFHEYNKYAKPIACDKGNGFECSFLTEVTDNKQSHLYMFKRNVEIEQIKLPIYVGFYLKDDGSLDTNTKRKVFCFFQTSVTFGLPFVSHAPFLTVDNRDTFKPGEEVNDFLINQLAQLAADALIVLRDLKTDEGNFLLTENIFDIVPVEYTNGQYEEDLSVRGETVDITPFFKAFTQMLKNEEIIYTNSGDYKSVCNVFMANDALRSLISKGQLNYMLRFVRENNTLIDDTALNTIGGFTQQKEKDFVKGAFDWKVREYMTNVLEIQVITSSDIAKLITPSFMAEQSDEWVEKLYGYVQKLRTNDERKPFLYAPIVKTQCGEWLAPFDEEDKEQVYLPVNQESEYFNAPYEFVSMDWYTHQRDFFLKTLRLSRPNITDYIRLVILPHYNGQTDDANDETLRQDFRTMMQIFFELKHDEDKRNASGFYGLQSEKLEFTSVTLADLSKLIKEDVPFKSVDGRLSKVCYLYEGNDELRTYFKGSDYFHEFDLNFYASYGTDWKKDTIRQFIHAIGIDTKHPRIVPNVYTEGNYVRTNYSIEEFSNGIKTASNSKLMWNSIIRNQDEFHKLKPYYYTYNHSVKKENGYTDVYVQLNNSHWIYTDEFTTCTPAEITLEAFHKLGYKECEKIEEELDFGKNAREEQYRQEEEKKRQQVIDNNAIIEVFGGNLDEAKKAKAFYDEFSNTSEEELQAFKDWQRKRENYVFKGNESSMPELDTENGYEVTNGFDFSDSSSKANTFKNINFIGLKLYEEYLKQKGWVYEELDHKEMIYNIKVEPNKLTCVSVIVGKEINTEKTNSIEVTKHQHALMHTYGTNNFTIIRIALRDLGLNYNKEIRDLFGSETDIDSDPVLKKRCEKFASDYWKAKSTEDFERMTAKYQVQVSREL